MIIHWLILLTSVLCVIISGQNNTDINNVQQTHLNVDEHKPSDKVAKDSSDESWKTTTERTLIRVTRLDTTTEVPKVDKRQRRQVIEAIQTAGFVINVAKAMKNTESENGDYEKIGEEILGMAKKVAIAVIVIVSLCILCCLVTTVIICVKCCGRSNRKRNQAPTTIQVPQPIFVHTGPSGYQPQFYQQHAPQTWSPVMVQSPESRPMLPQPSAPPRPNDHFHIEHPPPPYEKLYTGV